MSADNWAICPQCKITAEAKQQKLILAAGESYGKVTPEEYLSAVNAAKGVVKLTQTLREDYEQGMDDSGFYEVHYRCSCHFCSFEFSYKHSESALKTTP